MDEQFGKIPGKTKLFRSVLNDDLIMKSLTHSYVEKNLPIEALMLGAMLACKFRTTKTSAHFQSEFRIHQLVGRTHFFCSRVPCGVNHPYFVLLKLENFGLVRWKVKELFILGPVLVNRLKRNHIVDISSLGEIPSFLFIA